jgi:hypothetical protein
LYHSIPLLIASSVSDSCVIFLFFHPEKQQGRGLQSEICYFSKVQRPKPPHGEW